MTRTKIFAASAIVALLGCGPKAVHPAGTTKNPNLITQNEVASVISDNATAYDVIRKLRPAFLRSRGVSTMGLSAEPILVVYLDMVKVVGSPVTSLKSINAVQIRSIEYLNGIDATTRFGTDHGAGAILISTRGPGGQ
jgi:hypothetical protein